MAKKQKAQQEKQPKHPKWMRKAQKKYCHLATTMGGYSNCAPIYFKINRDDVFLKTMEEQVREIIEEFEDYTIQIGVRVTPQGR